MTTRTKNSSASAKHRQRRRAARASPTYHPNPPNTASVEPGPSQTVENLNPVLRGWGGYFRYGNPGQKFDTIDCYVNQRMAMLAGTKHGLRGWNWATRFDQQWVDSPGVHRFSGTIKPTTAHASR
jgi:hypothetical protein